MHPFYINLSAAKHIFSSIPRVRHDTLVRSHSRFCPKARMGKEIPRTARAERRERQAADRRAKFEEYYCSLGLDGAETL
jgi:hypothetical protein